MKSLLSCILLLFLLCTIQICHATVLCYGYTKVQGVRTNGVTVHIVYQSNPGIVLDTVSYHHPTYGDGYFHASKSGLLPAGNYYVHFEFGNYFKNRVITYNPLIGPVNMGDVELVRVEYASNDTTITLRNIQLEAVFWRQTGVIRGLAVKGHSGLLSAAQPGQIIFRDTLISCEYKQKDSGTVTNIDSSISSNKVRLVFEVDFHYHKASVNYTLDTLTLRWDNDVWLKTTYPTGIDRALRLDFSLPLLSKMHYGFWTDNDAPCKIDTTLNKGIKYRSYWNILSAVVLYDTTLDYGLSFICPLEVKKPALSFILRKNVSSDTFRISYNYLRMYLSTGKHAQASLYLVPHEGDWRPGLAWLHDQYPVYFDVNQNSHTLDHEGRFFFGGYYTTTSDMDTAKSYGVKWEEYYSHHPFFGLYAPRDRYQWMRISDTDTGTTYNYWFNDMGDPQHNYNYARNKFDEFNLRGIGSYNYFNAGDVWKKWVNTGDDTFQFKNYLAKKANGDTISGFPICWNINPDTNLYAGNPHSWAVHIDSQVSAVVDSYRTAAGIFLDRDDYCAYDYAHHDGVTMINTDSVYMLGFAQEEINQQICKAVHDSSKSIIANVPTSIEVCKNMDAIMNETNTHSAGKLQYLGLSRPLILFMADKIAYETEIKDKTALYGGYFPSLEREVNQDSSRLIDRNYQPIFDRYIGKTWMLNAHALRLPTGVKGNIFKALDNDLLIPMASMEKTQLLMDPFDYNLLVRVQVPGLAGYNHGYVLSGDYMGPTWLAFNPGSSVNLTIPAHLAGSLIRLSPVPRYEYCQTSLPVFCRDTAGTFKVRVQNLGASTKQYRLLLKTPFGNQRYNFSLDSGSVYEVQYGFLVPKNANLSEDTFWVIDTLPQPDDSTLFTAWIFDRLSLQLPPKIFIKYPDMDTFTLTLVNNTPYAMIITLNAGLTTGHGAVTISGLNPVALNSYERKDLQLQVGLNDIAGTLQITGICSGDTVGSITRSVSRAMKPTPGDAFFDEFERATMDGQWDTSTTPQSWSIENGQAKGSGNYSSHFATVAAGNANWTDYQFQVDTKMTGSADRFISYLKSYLYFRVQNDTQYYRFGIKGDEEMLYLNRRDGKYRWIILGKYGFLAPKNKWYNLAVKDSGSLIRCFLNGDQVISVNDAIYGHGGIGIGVTEDNMTNYYDHVVVRPIPLPDTLFADYFTSGQMDTLWDTLKGAWSFPAEEPHFVRGSGGAHFAVVANDGDWTGCRYQMRTRIIGSDLGPNLRSYLFSRVQDTLNYFRLGIYNNSGFDLHKRANGTWTLLVNYSVSIKKNTWYKIRVEIQDSLKCYLNDTLRIQYKDTNNPFLNGGIGIGVLEPEDMVTDYDDVLVQPLLD
jgi:hypothetical protein